MFPKLKYAAALLALTAVFTACTKKPDQVISPSIKVSIEKRDAGKVCMIDFSCALKNENDSVAFKDIKGEFTVHDDSGKLLLNVPFSLQIILPFDSGVIMQRVEMKEDEAAPLMQFFSISMEKLESGEDTGARPLEDKNVRIASLKYEKKDIIDLLKGK